MPQIGVLQTAAERLEPTVVLEGFRSGQKLFEKISHDGILASRYATRMVLFTLGFTFGVWLLQQQATLPDFAWAWLLTGLPLVLLIQRRFIQPVRAEPVVAFTDASICTERISTSSMRTGLFNASQALRITRTLLIAAFACGSGFYLAAWQAEQRLAVSLPYAWQGRDIEVIGVVAELPHANERGLRFAFDVEKTLTPEVVVPGRIYLSTYFDRRSAALEIHAGERWQFTLRLKPRSLACGDTRFYHAPITFDVRRSLPCIGKTDRKALFGLPGGQIKAAAAGKGGNQ